MNLINYLQRHNLPTSLFGMLASWSPLAVEFFKDAGEVFKLVNILIGFAIGVTVLAINIKKLREKEK